MYKNKKFNGFALAEILIVLGLVGVISVFTIPTLVTNISISTKKSQLKKVIATIRAAVTTTMAKYDIDFSTNSLDEACAITDDPSINSTFCAIFNAALSGHTLSDTPPVQSHAGTTITYYAPQNITGAPTEAPRYLTLNTGSIVVFSGKAKGCTKSSDGTSGFTTQSFAPSLIASKSIFFWPIAVQTTHLAEESNSFIPFKASIPVFTGIVRSRVNISGRSFSYIWIASSPFVASPAIT